MVDELIVQDLLDGSVPVYEYRADYEKISLDFIEACLCRIEALMDPNPEHQEHITRRFNLIHVVELGGKAIPIMNKHPGLFRRWLSIEYIASILLRKLTCDEISSLSPEYDLGWDKITSNHRIMEPLCMNPKLPIDIIRKYSDCVTRHNLWNVLCMYNEDTAGLYLNFSQNVSINVLLTSPHVTDDFVQKHGIRNQPINCKNLSIFFMLSHKQIFRFTGLEEHPDMTIALFREFGKKPKPIIMTCPRIRCMDATNLQLCPTSEYLFRMSRNPNITPEFVCLNIGLAQHNWWDMINAIRLAPFDMYEYYPKVYLFTYITWHPEMSIDDYHRHKDRISLGQQLTLY